MTTNSQSSANAAQPSREPDAAATQQPAVASGSATVAPHVDAAHSARPAVGPESHLPEPLPSLAFGSRFTKQINENDPKLVPLYRATRPQSTKALSANWYYKRLQQGYVDAKSAGIDPQMPRDTLLRALDEKASKANQTSSSDDVVRYSVAHAEGLTDLCASWEESAKKPYQNERCGYDTLLSDLIPDTLRQSVDWVKAVNAYDADTNPTALADWLVFPRRFLRHAKQPLRGLASGLASLDQALLGIDGLTLIAGPTGVGKTALAASIAMYALQAHSDLAVLYLLLDPGMTRPKLYERLWCATAGLDARSLRNPSPSQKKKMDEALDLLTGSILGRLKVVSIPPIGRDKDIDAEAINQYREKLVKATKADQVLVVIDYLSYLDIPKKTAPGSVDADIHRMATIQEARYQTRTSYCPEGDPYLVIAEINKSWDGKQPLTGNHLNGSTRQQYSPDSILMLEPLLTSDPSATSVPVDLRIVKARDGGIRTSIPLIFDHTRATFREAHQAPIQADSHPPTPTTIGTELDPMAGLEN